MYFFDALKRRKQHIDVYETHPIEINSEDYLKMKIENRYGLFVAWLSTLELKSAANLFEVKVLDTDEFMIEDEELFNIMSNIAIAYARTFDRQTKFVLSPSNRLLNEMPISPITLTLLTADFIVNKPIQIIINRSFNEGQFEEQVRLI